MGFAQAGKAIHDGDNLGIAGVKPSGIAAQGKVFWRAATPTWTLIASGYGLGNGSLTLDTTGANLIMLFAISPPWGNGGLTTLSDNLGVGSGVLDVGGGQPVNPIGNSLQVAHWINPPTGPNHTFTYSAVINSGAVICAAFKGPSTLAIDQIVGINAGSSSSSVQLPSMTPANSSLVLTLAASDNVGFTGVDSNFGIIENALQSGYMTICVASKITGGAAIAPTWTAGGTGNLAAAMLAFKPS